jgi:hypothetical protein
VRKARGSHEIATVQTTAIDKEAELIRLTTTLAHSSGEWLSSEWPVCAISETAAPRRMGAALTYARRYALFTLVGIAGEDDLDAPDLNAKIDIPAGDLTAAAAKAGAAQATPSGGSQGKASAFPPIAKRESRILPSRKTLEPEVLAALRQQLLADLALLQSDEGAAEWVHKNLPTKNTLTVADADLVEAGFREMLATIELASAVNEEPSADANTPRRQALVQKSQGEVREPLFQSNDASARSPIVMPAKVRGCRVTPKAIRLRDKEHCRFVTTQPCVVCGRGPSEAHHIRFAQPRALGRKVSDEYTVPVCRLHHRELHRYGDEASWWAGVSIDPLPIALDLWRQSRDNRSEEPPSKS